MHTISFPFLTLLHYYRKSTKRLVMTILKRIFFPFSEMDAIIPKSGVIIDLGCAEGIFTRYLALASPGRICYGIDLDGIRMRFGADQRFPAQIKLIQGDVLTAQFPSCT